MKDSVKRRLDAAERHNEDAKPVKPIPVLLEDTAGGWNCGGIHYLSLEEAHAANPGEECVEVRIVDCSKQ